MELKQHPLSAAFPSMGKDEFQALKDDIENCGQREPIIVLDGMVLDGWHRYRACIELGMKVKQFGFGTGDDPAEFVISHNLHRRHLTPSQRAAAVVACAQWQPPNLKAGVQPLHPTKTEPAAMGATVAPHAKTNAQMASEAKVSKRLIQQAKAVHGAGLDDPVKEGALTVQEAALIVEGKTEKPRSKAPPAPAPADEFGPDADELAAAAAAETADRDALQKLLDSDDKLSAAYAEIKRLNAVVATQQQRINGLMNEKSEAIRAAKSWQRKFNDAQRAAA